MKIGIMAAMPEEIISIEKHIQNRQKHIIAGREFITGKIEGNDIVLTFSRWGKVAAALTTSILILNFKVNKIIFCGVAGALSHDINIGDVVISEQLYQHDMNAEPLMPKHEIPLTGVIFFKATKNLVKNASESAELFLKSIAKTVPGIKEFNIANPKTFEGTIATGDEFIHTVDRKQAILAEKPKACAVDMESAAVGHVCCDFKVDFVVIRVISDNANEHAEIDFPKFIQTVATQILEGIILNMLRYEMRINLSIVTEQAEPLKLA